MSLSTQTAKGRQDHLEWEGIIGSLTSATITANSEPKTDMAVVKQCPINFKFLGILIPRIAPIPNYVSAYTA